MLYKIYYQQFYEIFINKKYQEKNIFNKKVILAIIENSKCNIKEKYETLRHKKKNQNSQMNDDKGNLPIKAIK